MYSSSGIKSPVQNYCRDSVYEFNPTSHFYQREKQNVETHIINSSLFLSDSFSMKENQKFTLF